jgi:hypothetical protein
VYPHAHELRLHTVYSRHSDDVRELKSANWTIEAHLLDRAASPPCSADPARSGSIVALDPSGNVVPGWPFVPPQPLANFDNGGVRRESPMNPGPLFVRSPADGGSDLPGSRREAIALETDGNVVSGWPLMLPGMQDVG